MRKLYFLLLPFFIMAPTLVMSAGVDDVPLEEQLEMLQSRLWDVMHSNDLDSVKEFGELLIAIEEKEREIKERGPLPDIVEIVENDVQPATETAEENVQSTPPVVVKENTSVPPIVEKQVHVAHHGEKRIVVDKDEYKMTLYMGDDVLDTQRVIVGREGRETPSFSSVITHVVINPYWSISPSIASNDLAPLFAENINLFYNGKYEVFESWKDDAPQLNPENVDWSRYANSGKFPHLLRQKPGPNNSVGLIKFVVEPTTPDTQGIILHGSPMNARHLFAKNEREFSSGCVRVEDEVKLTKLLLNHGSGYTEEQVQKMVDSGTTKWVKLREPVKVDVI